MFTPDDHGAGAFYDACWVHIENLWKMDIGGEGNRDLVSTRSGQYVVWGLWQSLHAPGDSSISMWVEHGGITLAECRYDTRASQPHDQWVKFFETDEDNMAVFLSIA